MEWPSREGWLHDESSCPCRVELKAPMSVSARTLCETSVRKLAILMSLGLMTKLYEDNFCVAAVDRVGPEE